VHTPSMSVCITDILLDSGQLDTSRTVDVEPPAILPIA
jgi:hypothetical protein